MIRRLFLFSIIIAAQLLVCRVALAESSIKYADWEEIKSQAQASKKYPFLAPIFEDLNDETGREVTDLSLGHFNLSPTQKMLALRIEDPDLCGAAFGCGTVFFLDDSQKGISRIYDIQLPGIIAAGLCKDNPVMVAQLFEPFTQEERFRTFPLGTDGRLHFGQIFPTINDVNLCAPIDTEEDPH